MPEIEPKPVDYRTAIRMLAYELECAPYEPEAQEWLVACLYNVSPNQVHADVQALPLQQSLKARPPGFEDR